MRNKSARRSMGTERETFHSRRYKVRSPILSNTWDLLFYIFENIFLDFLAAHCTYWWTFFHRFFFSHSPPWRRNFVAAILNNSNISVDSSLFYLTSHFYLNRFLVYRLWCFDCSCWSRCCLVMLPLLFRIIARYWKFSEIIRYAADKSADWVEVLTTNQFQPSSLNLNFFHLAVVAVWVHRFILWLWIFLSMREREEAGWKTNASSARAPLCKNSKNHAKAGAISIGIDQFSSTPDRPEALNLRWKEANQRIGKC